MEDIGLTDIWRLVNPKDREYTFYSHNHKSHSRIDYFLISKDLVNSVSDCSIGPIALTDHAIVHLGLVMGQDGNKGSRWRMNVSLLQDPIFSSEIKEELDFFFSVNMGTTDRVGTVWEASKAYIRGKIIAHSSKKKREERQRLKKLESQLKDLENALAEKHSDLLLKQVCDLKFQINEIYNKKAEYALFRLKGNFYESGEKSSKLLARQLRQKEASYAIPAVKNSKGELMMNTSDINKVFASFYNQLYKSEVNPGRSDYDAFFSKIEMPEISEDQKESLDRPISVDEVKRAISSMRVGRSPGLDGFASEYYKEYSDKLAPILTEVYKESFSVGNLPNTFNEALISLILKKDKDPTDPGSFRPVSLINVDCKIITKVLATRLENILPQIVHPDQVGFIKGRSSTDNVRRLLHLMQINHNKKTPIAAISLDAQKAFDRVEWSYLHYTLRKFGCGDRFIKWVNVIYSDPRAAVLTNGMISPFFKLTRGTKQGDPLSPLLFTLFLEPLAIAIRAESSIKGVSHGEEEHKMFLYADDILLVIEDPLLSIPHLLASIESFSKLSGYKINWQKSECMPISKGCSQSIFTKFQFKWVQTGLKYLGIRLCPELENIININMSPLIQKIKLNLDKWKLLKLTLWGKISIIKMVVAPQFNYISMMIPVTVSDGIFKQYNKLITEFLWNGKRPRIRLKKLLASRDCGGLALPNVELYSIAFEINKLARHWGTYISCPAWVKIEEGLACPFSVMELLSQKNTESQTTGKNLILRHSQWAWARAHKILGISQYKQSYSSIWNNPSVCIGKKVFLWQTWLVKGIRAVHDLYREQSFMSFEDLKKHFDLTDRGDFWRYLQLRSSVGAVFGLRRKEEKENVIQEFLNSPHFLHSASVFYKKMSSIETKMCEGLRVIWQRDFGMDIDEGVWQDVISNVGRATRDARNKFIHYKIVHRYYFTPNKLFKMGLTKDNKCWKCNREMGTFLHALWDCSLVLPFWKAVLQKFESWLGQPLPESPRLCLLGDRSQMPPGLAKAVTGVMITGFMVAARIILRKWKSPHRPEVTEWLKLMTEIASFELMIGRVQNNSSKTSQAWLYFVSSIVTDS